jgi:hypothetical protein
VRLGQAGKVEGVHLLGRVREIRVDFEAVQIADDHERRVFQVFAVKLQIR